MRHTLIRIEARREVPGVGDDDDFVGCGGRDEAFEAGADGVFRADDGGAEFAFHCGALPLGPQAGHGIDGRQELDGLVADEAQKALLRRGEKLLRGRVGFGSDDLDGDDEVGLGEDIVGVEILAVKARSCIEHVGREVGGEGEGKSERCRQARAEVARSEEGDGHIAVMAGNGFDGLAGLVGTEIGAQLFEQFGKVVAGLARGCGGGRAW